MPSRYISRQATALVCAVYYAALPKDIDAIVEDACPISNFGAGGPRPARPDELERARRIDHDVRISRAGHLLFQSR
jgi:hypothetical protein